MSTNLKQKLLGLDALFIDNAYLDLYCSLIEERGQQSSIKGLTEKHHIIQRAYFKQNDLKIDNTKENIAILTHHDHCLAHYYLCLCTQAPFTYLNEYAFIKMVKISSRFEFDFEQFLTEADKYNEIHQRFVTHQQEKAIERHKTQKAGTFGKHCYTDGIKYFYAYECPAGCWPEHHSKGRKLSDEKKASMSKAAKLRGQDPAYRKKLSEACKGKPGTVTGKVWINDGNIEKYISLENGIPEGWTRGRCPRSAAKNKHAKTTNGMKLISNGIEQHYINLEFETIPDGWYIGGSNAYKEKCRSSFAIGREKMKEIRNKNHEIKS